MTNRRVTTAPPVARAAATTVSRPVLSRVARAVQFSCSHPAVGQEIRSMTSSGSVATDHGDPPPGSADVAIVLAPPATQKRSVGQEIAISEPAGVIGVGDQAPGPAGSVEVSARPALSTDAQNAAVGQDT
jgi:hypothetical protein